MVSLEQVRLLETKVTRAIEYVKTVTGENTQLKEKLDSYQKRIEELEVLIQRFKEDQSRIEDGILSALDRLNQFEDALESTLSSESKPSGEIKNVEKIEPPEEEPAPVLINEPDIVEAEETDPASDDSGELDIF
jgi:FtsZ-binding cell division protein ZapB